MSFLLVLHQAHQSLLVVYIYSLYLVGNGETVKVNDDLPTHVAAPSTFVVKPGGGKEFIYTPVARNTTLQCSVVNASNLFWIINDFVLPSQENELSGFTLHQSEPALASMGELTSMLTVNGAIENNRIRICCQTDGFQKCCTSLITFDHPFSPENITIQSISAGSINITWDAESVAGVDQYYIVNFTSNVSSIRLTKPFLSLNQSIHDVPCGTSLLIAAVNGAGESSPSTLVLPSLPDIGPVTASLGHQVWKFDGQILVRVSFQPAETCIYYPVESYLLVLKSLSENAINVTLGCNETDTVLNRLEDNKMYSYSVTAINTIGNVTTYSKKLLTTSDVQNVTAIEVDEYTVNVHCYFIDGSDAQGCLVVFSSNLNSESIELFLKENDSVAWSVANLACPISCYHQVFGFDIEAVGNVSGLAIEGSVITNKSQVVCTVISQGSRMVSIIIFYVMAAFIAATAVLVPIFIILIYYRGKCAGYHSTRGLKNSENVENPTTTIHLCVSSGPNAQRSSNFQMKPNEAYEFWKVTD